MSREDEVRRQMEQDAADAQLEPQCPVEGSVDGAFSLRTQKKALRKQTPGGGYTIMGGKPAVFKSKKSGGLSSARRLKIDYKSGQGTSDRDLRK